MLWNRHFEAKREMQYNSLEIQRATFKQHTDQQHTFQNQKHSNGATLKKTHTFQKQTKTNKLNTYTSQKQKKQYDGCKKTDRKLELNLS